LVNFYVSLFFVELEKYLYGVVPKELSSYYPEVSKTQAILARTYALGHLGRFEAEGFDFTATQMFQVYGGFDAEEPLSNSAVDNTRGLVITYNNRLARYPLYHSTCGGATTSNENVYNADPVAYLRGVTCRFGFFHTNSPEQAGHETFDLNSDFLVNELPGLCYKTPYYRWTAGWTNDEMLQNIRKHWKNENINEFGTYSNIKT
jgi:SpoIID/LytB domain protein